MDFKAMMRIDEKMGFCGTENPPYLRNRSTTKLTDKPSASFSDGAKAVSQRDGVGEHKRHPIRFDGARIMCRLQSGRYSA
ncbi:hypothetical protein [Sinorhizobium fredii]|uniref:hypothetical protein n=1 Tax=Rhizobium fredii TaxID=380 RepID=UPI00138AC090|nr:hypothetical protein [Sinorhizobium fredii]